MTRLLRTSLALSLAALCLMAASAQARVVVDSFGPAGELGGQFGGQLGSGAAGVAVNSSGAGGVAPGTIYVSDRGISVSALGNNRIQRFSSSGVFERAWGQNVSGPDEQQRIELVNANGGTFTLSFGGNTTAPISAITSDEGILRNALAALPSVGAGNVVVFQGAGFSTSNRVWIVRFTGALSGTEVAQMTIDGSGITPPKGLTSSASVTTIKDGAGGNFTGFEICTVAASCQAGQAIATTANGGQLNLPGAIAVDQASGHVYVSEIDNRRISEFDADGNFLRAFGWDVVVPGGTGDVPGPTLNESQSVTLGANTTGGKFALSFEGHTTGASGAAKRTKESKVLTNVTTDDGEFAIGQVVSGVGIPAGTTITAVGADTLTLSAAPTSSSASTSALSAYDIPWDASPAAVQAALEDLPGIGAGNVGVTSANPGGGVIGGPYTVTFQGPFADTNVAQMTGAEGGLSVSSDQGSVQIATEVGGHPGGYEVCTVPSECKEGAEETKSPAEAYGGRFVREPGGLALDSSGDLWVADPGASRIQEFDPDGGFIAAYGWDVDGTGGGGGLEKCISAAPGGCRAATIGSAPGQFTLDRSGLRGTPTSLAFDSAGNLYAESLRIEKAGLEDAVFAKVERFDPTMSTAADFANAALSGFRVESRMQLTATDNGSRIAFGVDMAGQGYRIVELDLAGSPVETSIPNSGFVSFGGLGYDPSSDRLYATNPNQSGNGNGGYRDKVLILGDLPSPAPAMDPIIAFSAKTATFSGTVDPMGGPVSCEFQYSTDQVGWTDVPAPDCDSLVLGGGPQAVSQEAVGLSPLTHYFVRLRVTRLFDDTTAIDSSEQEFTTAALPPDISSVGVRQVDATSATLAGLVNPNNIATTYHFEYGLGGPCDSNPCASTPEGDLAAGIATPTVVSTELTGLQPDTTYHFRLLADNGPVGSLSVGEDVTFHTRATPLGPDVRAYEMVSPLEKNGGGALSGWQFVTLGRDGEAVGFCTDSLFGEPSGVQISTCAQYLSRRDSVGWQTESATPSACSTDLAGGTQGTGTALDQAVRFSANLEAAAFLQPESASCEFPPLDPAAKVPQKNLYRVDYQTDPWAYELLAPEATSPQTFQQAAGLVAATSEDFSHIVYASPSLQTADAPAGSFDKLYEWDNGTLRLASVMPNGSPATTAAQVSGSEALIGFGKYGLGNLVNAISNDGSRIFFQTPVGGLTQELYLREGGSATYDVSQSECTVTCGSSQADSLAFATPDGSKAFIASAAKLTDEDTASTGADLYRYSHPADPVANPPAADPHNLVLLSKDNEPADGNKATVLDVLGVSDDGEAAYFAAEGQIVAGTSTASGPKLYRWSWNEGSPMTQYLATLDSSDSVNWSPGAAKANEERLVTPDGRFLLINTIKALDPIDDHDADRDYYRWDEAGGWSCVSCVVLGGPSAGNASGPSRTAQNGLRRITMSEDGSRIFFQTPSALVPEDTNDIDDVYEWHEGQIELISTGAGTRPALYLGAGTSGRDVFFATPDGLVGADTDGLIDIYDARVGGGFPETPPPGAPCGSAEECHRGGTTPPTPAGAGSAAFQGPGNPSPNARPRCPKGKRSVRRGGKPRCVKRHSKRRQRANGDRRAGR